MRIDFTPNERPLESPQILAGTKTRELHLPEIYKLLKSDVIEPYMSEWTTLVLFVPIKDGMLSFCIVYRKDTSMIIKYTYPLPIINEFIDTLGEA